MNEIVDLEKCKTFIDCQLSAARPRRPAQPASLDRPVITLSRQTGAGGLTIADKLADYLRENDPQAPCGWAVFHKNLVEKVLDDHHLPKRLGQFMAEERISGIDDAVEELLGLHPSAWTLAQYTTETILHLARLGDVIIVGRGAHVITGGWKNALHVRLIGSLEKRVAHIREYFHLATEKEALEMIEREDGYRQRYLKKYFGKNIDDPLSYDIILNTDGVSYTEAARLIGETVLRRKGGG